VEDQTKELEMCRLWASKRADGPAVINEAVVSSKPSPCRYVTASRRLPYDPRPIVHFNDWNHIGDQLLEMDFRQQAKLKRRRHERGDEHGVVNRDK